MSAKIRTTYKDRQAGTNGCLVVRRSAWAWDAGLNRPAPTTARMQGRTFHPCTNSGQKLDSVFIREFDSARLVRVHGS